MFCPGCLSRETKCFLEKIPPQRFEKKKLHCGHLQDVFVSWLQKYAYSLGHAFIFHSKFQKLAWTSFLGKVWKEELVCTRSRNETAGLMGLQVFPQRGGNPFGHLHWPLCGCNLSLSLCLLLKLSVWTSVVLHPTSQWTVREKFLTGIADK